MSVIESLKDKITNVQHDITAGFKSITTRKKSIPHTPFTDTVNLDAGADLLHKYHENWAQISKSSSDTAKKADDADRQIQKLYRSLEEQHQGIEGILRLANTMPELIDSINSAMTKLGSLECDINEVENMLVALEDLCEQQDHTGNRLHHEHMLVQYKDRKNTDLEQTKVTLAQIHAAKIQGQESRIQELIREKQLAFEDDYSKEIEHYKQTGQTNFKPSTSSDLSVDLADITIEDQEGSSALDVFLNTKSDPDKTLTENGDTEAAEEDSEEEKPEAGASPVQITPDGDIDTSDSDNNMNKASLQHSDIDQDNNNESSAKRDANDPEPCDSNVSESHS